MDSLAKLAEVLECSVSDLISDEADNEIHAGAGMSELVSAWSPRPTLPTHTDFEKAIQALFPSARHRGYLRANASIAELHISKGDIIVIDLNPKYGVGDLVAVNAHDPATDKSLTRLCRYVPPYLVETSAELSSTPLLADSDRNAIMGLVLGILRSSDL